MGDPISIIGLAIAVVDGLWKIGNGTAELIADFRSAGNDTRSLGNKVSNENNRTLALRCLLFQPLPIYGNQTLFEKFDKEVQNEIQIFFEDLRATIDQAYQLLLHRSGRIGDNEATSSIHKLTRQNNSSSSLLSLQHWQWTLKDKKRVEAIIDRYGELNRRITENIKLWCLATSIGVNLQHLHRLRDDENAQALGFNVDATLQLATTDPGPPIETLELGSVVLTQALHEARVVEERFGILTYNGETLLIG
ncbi:Protein kinase [Lasiodiplodia theobromae]|uniref:Protein kinase n=1 Tax=Lasiodiplodia theobromae TaxID=45133 RepID=UPI0015C33CCF|nr:Protein kinase [Lasiodiplodia theobromae]KAF4539616.1 Protein kinase [Lasiodiplodia theobromae]